MNDDTAQYRDDPRIRMAAERTLLAWIRTGLAMMGFGFVVARFGLFLRELVLAKNGIPPERYGYSLWIGIFLVLLGVTVTLLAALQHWQFLTHRKQGLPFEPSWSLGLAVAVLLAGIGMGMAIYLVLVQ